MDWPAITLLTIGAVFTVCVFGWLAWRAIGGGKKSKSITDDIP